VTSHTPRNRKLDTISDRIYRASVNSQAAFGFLNEQRSQIPSLAASNTDGGTRGSGHSDPTLRTTVRLLAIGDKRQAIDDMIATLELGTDLLDEAIRDAYRIGTDGAQTEGPTTDDRPLCRGGQPDTWGDPDCGRHVEHYTRSDGTMAFRSEMLCATHRKRKMAWEREQAA
jgi:hypothetical protein